MTQRNTPDRSRPLAQSGALLGVAIVVLLAILGLFVLPEAERRESQVETDLASTQVGVLATGELGWPHGEEVESETDGFAEGVGDAQFESVSAQRIRGDGADGSTLDLTVEVSLDGAPMRGGIVEILDSRQLLDEVGQARFLLDLGSGLANYAARIQSESDLWIRDFSYSEILDGTLELFLVTAPPSAGRYAIRGAVVNDAGLALEGQVVICFDGMGRVLGSDMTLFDGSYFLDLEGDLSQSGLVVFDPADGVVRALLSSAVAEVKRVGVYDEFEWSPVVSETLVHLDEKVALLDSAISRRRLVLPGVAGLGVWLDLTLLLEPFGEVHSIDRSVRAGVHVELQSSELSVGALFPFRDLSRLLQGVPLDLDGVEYFAGSDFRFGPLCLSCDCLVPSDIPGVYTMCDSLEPQPQGRQRMAILGEFSLGVAPVVGSGFVPLAHKSMYALDVDEARLAAGVAFGDVHFELADVEGATRVEVRFAVGQLHVPSAVADAFSNQVNWAFMPRNGLLLGESGGSIVLSLPRMNGTIVARWISSDGKTVGTFSGQLNVGGADLRVLLQPQG